jgi:hypothetical protein
MSYRRGRPVRYRSYGASRDAGLEAALRHIEEAKAFSHELGGTDQDVKAYFFSLNGLELEGILFEYGRRYGSSAESWARTTLPRWKSGTTKMSGQVAKRLFDLLPPRMPPAKKYELATNVWRHFGPQSSHSFVVGPDANIEVLAQTVSTKLDEAVSKYSVPVNVQNRFSWLAAGDVRVKEDLLNYFRQMEKQLALDKIRLELPVLQRHFRENLSVSKHANVMVQVHKHCISLSLDGKLGTEFREQAVAPSIASMASGDRAPIAFIVFLLIIGFVLLMAIFGH